MFKYDEQESRCRVDIDGEMCIYNASELKQKLLAVLDDPRELVINLSNVTEIDSAGIQLLMMAKKERAKRGMALKLMNHNGSVLDIFELMDLVGYFNEPVMLANANGGKV